MKKGIFKLWVILSVMMAIPNHCLADGNGFCFADRNGFHNVVERFDSLVTQLKDRNAVVNQEYERFEDGEYVIYHFEVSADFCKDAIIPYSRTLSWVIDSQTEETNSNSYNKYEKSNPISVVKYGNNFSKTITLGDKQVKWLFNMQKLHEAGNIGRKHVFAITWHKKGRRFEGKLCHFVNTQNDTSSKIYASPQNTADFLMLLNNFRAAFAQLSKMPDTYNDKILVQTGLANKILKLCKVYGYLLDEEGRTLCSQAIYGMCQDLNDTFLKTTLTVAGKALEKGEFSTDQK